MTEGPRRCRKCGCTDFCPCWHAEMGGCWWVEAELCAACSPAAEPGWEHPTSEEIAAIAEECP
jgi:hypothetical protein